MTTLEIRKVTGAKNQRVISIPHSWCDYHNIQKGETIYLLTGSPFMLVTAPNVNMEKVKKIFEEMQRAYMAVDRPPARKTGKKASDVTADDDDIHETFAPAPEEKKEV